MKHLTQFLTQSGEKSESPLTAKTMPNSRKQKASALDVRDILPYNVGRNK